jgi:hypothetical protein
VSEDNNVEGKGGEETMEIDFEIGEGHVNV